MYLLGIEIPYLGKAHLDLFSYNNIISIYIYNTTMLLYPYNNIICRVACLISCVLSPVLYSLAIRICARTDTQTPTISDGFRRAVFALVGQDESQFVHTEILLFRDHSGGSFLFCFLFDFFCSVRRKNRNTHTMWGENGDVWHTTILFFRTESRP